MQEIGFQNESELFLGLLLEREKFKAKNLVESFFVISQISLIKLYKKYLAIFKEIIENFEENMEIIAKYMYLITYFFAGCYFHENLSKNMANLLGNFKTKIKRVFLGLPWLIFSKKYLELKNII